MAKKRSHSNSPKLFHGQVAPVDPKTGRLFDNEYVASDQPVTCLGMTFKDDEARRNYFTEELRQKLKDPHFRSIAGFPIGQDEDIIRLSNPPYYTACPNPWIARFCELYGTEYEPNAHYSRFPLVVDASVGKYDSLYKAHSYHTKVPHLAIVPSILHYTEPNALIFDGFCGSGMVGVAAQFCDQAPASYRLELEELCKEQGRLPPTWGPRRAILADLSPIATFIASNYNTFVDISHFKTAASHILNELQDEIGWMYSTNDPQKGLALIEYTVWSEVFFCHSCSGEIVFEEVAVDGETYRINDTIECPHCGAIGAKEEMSLSFETIIDPVSKEERMLPKRVPSKIFYKSDGVLKHKKPDANDYETLERIQSLPFPDDFPDARFPDSQMKRVGRMTTTNTTSISDLYVRRAAHALGALWRKAKQYPDFSISRFLVFTVEQSIWGLSALNRYQPSQHVNYGGSQVNRQLNGVYYIGSMYAECSPWHNLDGKVNRLFSAFKNYRPSNDRTLISVGTASCTGIKDNTIDYIFTDPPFGENIYYADLNFLIESWHGVLTDVGPEAIVDRVRKKSVQDYQHKMTAAFREFSRVLKPGRWMTVVFSNSKASVWNAIQVALQSAGFVVAEVAALDKRTGSFKQVTSATAVKQDLVISAYKPNGGLEERYIEKGAIVETAWDFVRTHLKQLPISKVRGSNLEFVVEREPRRVYDRMIAWFVKHDAAVPLSSDEFLVTVRQKFIERDGMLFLQEQVEQYEKHRLQFSETPQLSLFVTDEVSALQWLRMQLREKPQTASDLTPLFLKELQVLVKHEKLPDVRELLSQNFLCYDGKGDVPDQIHSYLSSNWKDLRNLRKDDPSLVAKAKDRWYVPDAKKAGDLEKLRERSLLKDFDEYRNAKRKFKNSDQFRLESIRAGFKKAWQERDYTTIINVAEKLPDDVLEEDAKLLMWYNQAVTRSGGGA